MKNVFALIATLAAGAIFTACSDDFNELGSQNTATGTINSKVEYIAPKALQSKKCRPNYDINPSADPGYNTPVDGKYRVFYYIRIDGKIPGNDASTYPANDYFPRNTNPNVSVFTYLNAGYAKAKADWRSKPGIDKYIFASDGVAVQNVLIKVPTLDELVAANSYPGDDFSGLLNHKDELHIIWYVCKRQSGADHAWHVDGILTTKDKTNITDTDFFDKVPDDYVDDKDHTPTFVPEPVVTPNTPVPSTQMKGEVEFDVHQQMHNDWHEIKTSIHLRDTVDAKIIIPIPEEYQALCDDFAIRAGQRFEHIEKTIQVGNKYFTFQFEIGHTAQGIEISVVSEDKEELARALKLARQCYGDGITFEVHTYVKSTATQEQVWEWVKQTKRLDTYTDQWTPGSIVTHTYGQVTSAYFTDEYHYNEYPAEGAQLIEAPAAYTLGDLAYTAGEQGIDVYPVSMIHGQGNDIDVFLYYYDNGQLREVALPFSANHGYDFTGQYQAGVHVDMAPGTRYGFGVRMTIDDVEATQYTESEHNLLGDTAATSVKTGSAQLGELTYIGFSRMLEGETGKVVIAVK